MAGIVYITACLRKVVFEPLWADLKARLQAVGQIILKHIGELRGTVCDDSGT